MLLESFVSFFRLNSTVLSNFIHACTFVAGFNEDQPNPSALEELEGMIDSRLMIIPDILEKVLDLKKLSLKYLQGILESMAEEKKPITPHLVDLSNMISTYLGNSNDKDLMLHLLVVSDLFKSQIDDRFFIQQFEEYLDEALFSKYFESDNFEERGSESSSAAARMQNRKLQRKQTKRFTTKTDTNHFEVSGNTLNTSHVADVKRMSSLAQIADPETAYLRDSMLIGEEDMTISPGSNLKKDSTDIDEILAAGSRKSLTIEKPQLLAFFPKIIESLKSGYTLVDRLLGFIIDPLNADLGDVWEKVYPEYSEMPIEKYFKEQYLGKTLLSDPDVCKQIPLHFFRAYKTVETLSLPSNLRVLFNCCETFMDIFFRRVCEELDPSEDEDTIYNPNLIASMILAFLQVEPFATYNYLMFYNAPFLMARYLNHSKIFDVLLALAFPQPAIAETTEEMTLKLWNYFRQSDFFPDLVSTLGKPKCLFPEKLKQSVEYKPVKCADLSRLSMGNTNKNLLKLLGTKFYQGLTRGVMVEDAKFIVADIDRVREHFKYSKQKSNNMTRELQEHTTSPQSKKLKRSDTLELINDQEAIIQEIKRNFPLNSKDTLIITSPERLAQIEPFKMVMHLSDSGAKLRKDGSSSRTNKTVRMHRGSVVLTNGSSLKKRLTTKVSPFSLGEASLIRTGSKQFDKLPERNTLVAAVPKKSEKEVPKSTFGQEALPPIQGISGNHHNSSTTRRASVLGDKEKRGSFSTQRKDPQENSHRQGKSVDHQYISVPVEMSTRSGQNPSSHPVGTQRYNLHSNSRQGQGRTFSTTLFIPQLLCRENIAVLSALYPSQTKFATLTEFDRSCTQMSFPKDFLEGEQHSVATTEFLLEILNCIQASESSFLTKLKVSKKTQNPTQLCITLFERNEFSVFQSLLLHCYSRYPLIRLLQHNSAILAGQFVCQCLKLSEMDTSFLKQYRRKFHAILVENFSYLQRLIISCFTLPKEGPLAGGTSAQSHSAAGGGSPAVGIAAQTLPKSGTYQVVLLKLLAYILKWEGIFQRGVYPQLSEFVWEIVLEWFFNFG